MRRRLVAVSAAITAMVVVAFLVPLAIVVRSLAYDRAVDAADELARSLATALGGRTDSELLPAVEAARERARGPVTVYLPDRQLGDVIARDAAVDEAADEQRAFTAPVRGDGVAVLVPVILRGGRTGVVRVGVPTAALREGVVEATAVLVALGVVLIGVAMLVADRLGRAVVVPSRQIADVAQRLSEGELDARAPAEGPPEVVAVATALNTLAGRIRVLLAAERESVADLSHRLRTPLTALRLDAEGLSDADESARLSNDVDALERAVTQVIHEVRRIPEQRAVADLAAVVRQRATFWGALAEDQARAWSVDAPDGEVLVGVAEDELGAVLDALLGNVFAHTPDGTSFSVSVAAAPDGGGVLTVADRGPGYAHAAPRRGASGSGSTGLGLDIARRAAEASGGILEVGGDHTGARTLVRFGPPRPA